MRCAKGDLRAIFDRPRSCWRAAVDQGERYLGVALEPPSSWLGATSRQLQRCLVQLRSSLRATKELFQSYLIEGHHADMNCYIHTVFVFGLNSRRCKLYSYRSVLFSLDFLNMYLLHRPPPSGSHIGPVDISAP